MKNETSFRRTRRSFGGVAQCHPFMQSFAYMYDRTVHRKFNSAVQCSIGRRSYLTIPATLQRQCSWANGTDRQYCGTVLNLAPSVTICGVQRRKKAS
jgi:hypothetical protein